VVSQCIFGKSISWLLAEFTVVGANILMLGALSFLGRLVLLGG
jgi:hypothetical protein